MASVTPIRGGWNSGTGPGRPGDGCAYTLAFPRLRVVLYRLPYLKERR